MKKLGSIHPIKLVLITALILANLTTYLVFFTNNNQKHQVLGLASDTAMERAAGAKASKVPKATKPPKGNPSPSPSPSRMPTPLPSGPTQIVYLSDLTPIAIENGFGPYEKNKSNGEDKTGDGRIITLNGITYTKGLGVHAISKLVYRLDGKCTKFNAFVGVDDEVGTRGSAVFKVKFDGKDAAVWESGVMTGATATKTVDISTVGKQTIDLIVGANSDTNLDHGDWADAKVTCVGLVATPTPIPTPTPDPDLVNIDTSPPTLFYTDLEYNTVTKSVRQVISGQLQSDLPLLFPNIPSNSADFFPIKVKSTSDRNVRLNTGWEMLPINAISMPNNIYKFRVKAKYKPKATIKVYIPNGTHEKLIWSGKMN